jgi:oligogalacturonide transporter
MVNASPERKMNTGRMIAYGSGDLFGGGSATAIAVMYTLFLTTVANIHPVTVGIIFIVIKVISAITNPVMGYISDHTRSRFGRRRVFFLVGCLPFFALPWIVMDFGNPAVNAVWYGGLFVLYNLFATVVSVPYNSILPDMTSDYGERSKAIGIRMVFSKIGTIAGTWLPLTIVGLFAVKSRGYAVMGVAMGVFFAIPWIVVFLFTWERATAFVPPSGSIISELSGMFRDFSSTLKNASFRKHLVMYLGALTTFDVFSAVFILLVTISMNRPIEFGRDVLTTVQLSQFIGLPIATWLCVRFSNSVAYAVSAVSFAGSIIVIALMPDDASYPMMASAGLFTGIGIAGTVMSSWNNLSFVTDVDEMITAKRREGVYAGFQSFMRQLSQGLAMLLTNLCLAAIGFVTQAKAQPESVREGLRVFIMVAPSVLLAAGIAGACFYRVNRRNYDILMAEITRLRAGGSKDDVRPEARKTVELLTGIGYMKLWDDRTERK